MDQQKHEIVEKLQAANNILVTVSNSPSVDQLSACIGLTLLLNKLDKHATAVFSGQIPSTIEFLKPEETLEKNTDSLRDFIIALDKTKADKLRYKVEDNVVKIFITPYRTSLSSDDLNFSQGDFNIDIVVALGVHQQADLDEAITAHGRILHDATVACINNTPNGELGTVNWSKTDASSLSELVVELAKSFDQPLLDEQIATALLTGIVAETDRFRNEKTTATTMTLSADLMNAGANQKLVAEELEHEVDVQRSDKPADTSNDKQPDDKPAKTEKKSDDGTIEIDHEQKMAEETPQFDPSAFETDQNDKPDDKPAEEAKAPELPKAAATPPQGESRSLITEAPTLGGRLTANTQPEDANYGPAIDPLAGDKSSQPLLDHEVPAAGPKAPPIEPPKPVEAPPQPPMPAPKPLSVPEPPKPSLPPTPLAPPAFTPPSFNAAPPMPPAPQPAPAPKAPEPPKPESLTEREEPPQADDQLDEVEKARQEVLRAINEQPTTNLPPVQALNAQPVDLGKHDAALPPQQASAPLPPLAPAQPVQPTPLPPNAPEQAPFPSSPADQPLTMPMPPGVTLPTPQPSPPVNGPAVSPNSPPPVPPPMLPPTWPPKQ